MRRVLLVGGSPRIRLDAVRFLSAAGSGRTACRLCELLEAAAVPCELLLSRDAMPEREAQRYSDRAELESALRSWICDASDSVLVMSAAVNDYERAEVLARRDGAWQAIPVDGKTPSGADELRISLRPAGKIIDQLRDWGHRGPLVACKYEAAETVLASAQALAARCNADLVLANSLDGAVQALIDASGVWRAADRDAVVAEMAQRVVALASS